MNNDKEKHKKKKKTWKIVASDLNMLLTKTDT